MVPPFDSTHPKRLRNTKLTIPLITPTTTLNTLKKKYDDINVPLLSIVIMHHAVEKFTTVVF